MLKRMIAPMLLIATALVLLAFQPALASEYYSARTPLSGASDAALNNINLAIDALNGTVVPFDADFSFNETVGPRTKTRGFQKAANGRGVRVTGGGVAQVASTLYLALLQVRGDIDIDPVKTYGANFTGSYVSDVSQAIVVDYDADIDLSFTNNEDEMTIEMWASDSYVYCSITVGSDNETAWIPSGSTGGGHASGAGGGDDDEYEAEYSGSWFFTPSEDEPERELIASASLCCGDEDGVLNNVELAADCVNDTVLNHRDIFSFNDIVGPRTKKYGYVSATNGRGVRVVGGGVAQVATVIWLAIKEVDDISIIEKSTYGHKYNQDYVDRSSDAIITDYSNDRDFSFRYTGDESITIYTYMSDNWLYCDIYGD